MQQIYRHSDPALFQASAPDHAPQPSGLLLLSSANRLAYEEYGNPAGEPWFYFHDSGNSRLECAFFHAAAKARGIRLLAVDRPGIGSSSYYRADTPVPFSIDVLELADRLGIGTFSIMSHGTGGVYSLALATLAPKRIRKQINLGGLPGSVLVADRKEGSWWNGIAPPVIEALVRLRLQLSRKPSLEYCEPLLHELTSTDSKILRKPRIRQILELDRREAIRQGGKGVAQDIAMGFRKQDFSLKDMQVPLVIWQGRSETPSENSETAYLSARLPEARCFQLPFRGYYFFLQDIDAVFARIVAPSAFAGRLAA